MPSAFIGRFHHKSRDPASSVIPLFRLLANNSAVLSPAGWDNAAGAPPIRMIATPSRRNNQRHSRYFRKNRMASKFCNFIKRARRVDEAIGVSGCSGSWCSYSALTRVDTGILRRYRPCALMKRFSSSNGCFNVWYRYIEDLIRP